MRGGEGEEDKGGKGKGKGWGEVRRSPAYASPPLLSKHRVSFLQERDQTLLRIGHFPRPLPYRILGGHRGGTPTARSSS